jgi:hypothetical protein
VVEPLVLPTGTDAEVGGKPTAAAANTGTGTDVVDECGVEHTSSDTLGEHYRMVPLPPFSSCSPCGCGSHHL